MQQTTRFKLTINNPLHCSITQVFINLGVPPHIQTTFANKKKNKQNIRIIKIEKKNKVIKLTCHNK
jgi:hypothetical protein